MYTMIKDVERLICIPPAELGEDFDSTVDKLTWETYGGRLGEDKSFTVLIQNVRPVGPGRIVHGNGGVHQAVKFDQVVFKPENDEIIEGNVVEIVKFGAFVRFGPLDGLLHVSQSWTTASTSTSPTRGSSGRRAEGISPSGTL